jgi:hypothetical protein
VISGRIITLLVVSVVGAVIAMAGVWAILHCPTKTDHHSPQVCHTWPTAMEVLLTNIDKDKAQTNPSGTFDKPDDVVTSKHLKPGEKEKALQEWELDARLMDVAIDEGMTSKGEDGGSNEDGSNKVAAKSLLPEVKKAQKDLGAKPIPDEGAPTRFTP